MILDTAARAVREPVLHGVTQEVLLIHPTGESRALSSVERHPAFAQGRPRCRQCRQRDADEVLALEEAAPNLRRKMLAESDDWSKVRALIAVFGLTPFLEADVVLGAWDRLIRADEAPTPTHEILRISIGGTRRHPVAEVVGRAPCWYGHNALRVDSHDDYGSASVYFADIAVECADPTQGWRVRWYTNRLTGRRNEVSIGLAPLGTRLEFQGSEVTGDIVEPEPAVVNDETMAKVAVSAVRPPGWRLSTDRWWTDVLGRAGLLDTAVCSDLRSVRR